jgi:hypothetical protein
MPMPQLDEHSDQWVQVAQPPSTLFTLTQSYHSPGVGVDLKIISFAINYFWIFFCCCCDSSVVKEHLKRTQFRDEACCANKV